MYKKIEGIRKESLEIYKKPRKPPQILANDRNRTRDTASNVHKFLRILFESLKFFYSF